MYGKEKSRGLPYKKPIVYQHVSRTKEMFAQWADFRKFLKRWGGGHQLQVPTDRTLKDGAKTKFITGVLDKSMAAPKYRGLY